MEYFVYGRDRPGAFGLKVRLSEDHWSFMDGYAKRLVARGPTLTGDAAESTGSLHIVDLPDAEAARAFAYEEPYYRAGVFGSVLLCRFHNVLGRTMWDFTEAVEGYGRFLVIGMDESVPAPVTSKHMIVYGELLALDGEARLGRAALVEAPDREAAAMLLPAGGAGRTEVHPWRFGGRPTQRS
ncbi:YciI family protein [Microtetraspora malaysiensis]|uniref:YciI family protein n=1 Tax=Microtetraspora malaysiensis TaxID=161358 RepID=UPI0008333248|nr:YciI family protein [Microtetraspora malaysiensis]